MPDQPNRAEGQLLRWMKLQALLLGGILIALLVCAVLIGSSVNRLDRSMDLVEQDLKAIDVDRINEAAASLKSAADQLAAVDIDALNRAVVSLRNAADSLSSVDV